MDVGSLGVLFVIFVILAEIVRRDALKEGLPPRYAWYAGLIAGGGATAVSIILLVLIT